MYFGFNAVFEALVMRSLTSMTISANFTRESAIPCYVLTNLKNISLALCKNLPKISGHFSKFWNKVRRALQYTGCIAKKVLIQLKSPRILKHGISKRSESWYHKRASGRSRWALFPSICRWLWQNIKLPDEENASTMLSAMAYGSMRATNKLFSSSSREGRSSFVTTTALPGDLEDLRRGQSWIGCHLAGIEVPARSLVFESRDNFLPRFRQR